MLKMDIRDPYFFAGSLLAVIILVSTVAGGIGLLSGQPAIVQVAIADGALAIIGIVLLRSLGWWKKAGYTRFIRLPDLPLFLLPVIVALLSLSGGIVVTAPAWIVGFALFSLLIGFTEETFFRGLMLTGLLPRGVYRAVFISSIIFAALHLLNVLTGLWNPLFTLADTVAAFGIGITFAALRVRTGSIWPLIGIHALIDFCALLALGSLDVTAQSPESLVISVFVGMLLTGYGLFLLAGKIIDRESPNNHDNDSG
jgi:uncharacterized protein